MKISQRGEKIKLNQVMNISVDVHKDVLNFFFETGDKEHVDECNNSTTVNSNVKGSSPLFASIRHLFVIVFLFLKNVPSSPPCSPT
jgi:hypothetical protein